MFKLQFKRLPLYPGESPKVGLGLWNSVVLMVLVEGVLLIAGTLMYVRTKRAHGEMITWRLWTLLIFLVIIYAMNLFGPPPPNVLVVAGVGGLQKIRVFLIHAPHAVASNRGLIDIMMCR